MSGFQEDNSTAPLKIQLRQNALRELHQEPIVMETNGGYGRIFTRCYQDVKRGVVFEKKPEKAEALALQRPSWCVYEADCEVSIAAGAGSHMDVNFLDCDPYGESFPIIEAFFTSKRPFPRRMILAVNDGLRQGVKMNNSWRVKCLTPFVAKYGNRLHDRYLQVCKEFTTQTVARAGYDIVRWCGYYTGDAQNMTHFAAVLER